MNPEKDFLDFVESISKTYQYNLRNLTTDICFPIQS